MQERNFIETSKQRFCCNYKRANQAQTFKSAFLFGLMHRHKLSVATHAFLRERVEVVMGWVAWDSFSPASEVVHSSAVDLVMDKQIYAACLDVAKSASAKAPL